MNRSKFNEFIDTREVHTPIHIIGCGAIGSTVCMELARMGFEELNIYDFDTVDEHNIANQQFYIDDINTSKVDACEKNILNINPLCTVIKHPNGLQEPYIVNGIIIMCVDNIELRQEIVKANKKNPYCECFLDFRMRLTDAQHYFALNDWQVDELYKTMDFTHAEAAEATPTSACGVELSVVYAPVAIVSYGVANLIRYIKGKEPFNLVNVDMMEFEVDKFIWKKRKAKDDFISSLERFGC